MSVSQSFHPAILVSEHFNRFTQGVPVKREIVKRSYRDYLSYYEAKPQDAAKLLSTGESKPDPKLPKPQFAAMTMVANELFNLDEVLTK